MFLFYVFQSTSMNFMIYIKITRLQMNDFRKKKTYLATINIICYNMNDSENSNKFVPNLHNKTNYIIQYYNFKLYLELRVRLTNVHCVLSFDQLPWLENYINFHTREHTAAKNDFEKDFLKLMDNMFFVLLFWFILCRQSFFSVYDYLFYAFIDSFIAG